jgi:hypothetical protein
MNWHIFANACLYIVPTNCHQTEDNYIHFGNLEILRVRWWTPRVDTTSRSEDMTSLSRDVRIVIVIQQTWQFCRCKKQPGPQVFNDKPKSFHWWRWYMGDKRYQKVGNRANGYDATLIWTSGCVCDTVWYQIGNNQGYVYRTAHDISFQSIIADKMLSGQMWKINGTRSWSY